ncbi:hypothetical protein [Bacillus sp. KH172YL63]|uniref:hypothetical protein n=1 Tax=Bacillus sp. KH172YL63 TaxID=2709784 RepID=UPI0013E4E817|nr:hypothetical protein [Bacillus sp. KH172YL63]BCB05244.1 hypothetical protein KH172YL63_33770 [Bacillus sp. KH172YL63]
MNTEYFIYNERLGIFLPRLTKEWPAYKGSEQEAILLAWEQVRGTIPDRIQEIDREIEVLQGKLSEEEDFETSCSINREISERASEINDLWIWYRTTPEKIEGE